MTLIYKLHVQNVGPSKQVPS